MASTGTVRIPISTEAVVRARGQVRRRLAREFAFAGVVIFAVGFNTGLWVRRSA